MAVDPNTYNTLKDVSGMSDSEVDAYLKTHAPTGTYEWNAAQVHGNKLVVPTVKNGVVAMSTLDLGFTPDKQVDSTVKTDSGVYIIYKDGTTSLIGGTGSSGDNWGNISENDKTDIVNYLRTQPDFSESDLEKVKTDRNFQAVVLQQVQAEKNAVVNPFK